MDSQYGEENPMESHTEDDYIITSHDITKTRHHEDKTSSHQAKNKFFDPLYN